MRFIVSLFKNESAGSEKYVYLSSQFFAQTPQTRAQRIYNFP